MKLIKNKLGFTLIEIIIVLMILVAFSMVVIPKINLFIINAKLASDQATVKQLNSATSLYYIKDHNDNPFEDSSKSSEFLLNVLLNENLITRVVSPQSKDAKFTWVLNDKRWYLQLGSNSYVISLIDGISLNTDGYYIGRIYGSYSSSSQFITIPTILDGVTVKRIWQDVFKSKGLTGVEFALDSQIIQIHARAFYDNNISNVVFPNTLERIDLWAFKNNQLTTITLPASIKTIEAQAFNGNAIKTITINSDSVSIGDQAFGEYTEQFKQAFAIGKAGTYILVDGQWVKQTD